MAIDLETLGLTEMIRLREQIAEILAHKFERTMAVAVVGASPDPGLAAALAGPGRIVAPAADRLVVCFPSADEAFAAFIELRKQPDSPTLAVGIHSGRVLTDGARVVGAAVDLAAGVAATARPDEVLLTRSAHAELSSRFRMRCRPAAAMELGGRPIEVVHIDWRARSPLPTNVRVRETAEVLSIPDQTVVVFGRPPEVPGPGAPDVLLVLPDPATQKRISERHFELRRDLDEVFLHALAEHIEVNGRPVPPGERTRITLGSTVRLGDVMFIMFRGDDAREDAGETMVLQKPVIIKPPRRPD